ncbi:MAG TPA: glycine cleavage T C-terminal barrel domain-containing protein [Bryobacteraceae bacterium]|jgi:aminomethyltransferase|nr:glycine cleavage T C-terminal barrel domain-containing protein [Bryobacteraceae bacterium]
MKAYRALREGAAWLELAGRGKIRVTGEDRARLLHAMTTNHVQGLQPGEGCYAFFLNAQGRILGDVSIFCRSDHFLLDTEPETARKLYEHLDKYIIVDDVVLEDLTPSTTTIAIEGPRAFAALVQIGAPTPPAPYASEQWGARLVANLSYTGSPGYFIMAPAEERASLMEQIESAGIEAADEEAFRVVRLEHGKPRYGEDMSERYLAQEANQMHALHFSKGCYLGQEIVERVRSRAQIHRRLLPLSIDADQPPAAGTKLTKNGAPAAEITSAAFSPALGHAVALAYVRTEYKPGDVLSCDGATATVLASPQAPKSEPINCH